MDPRTTQEPSRSPRQRLLEAYRAVGSDPRPDGQEFYGQFGEDRILAKFFEDVPVGFFVEVGAYDGVDMSNTLTFEKRGWQGILVEADPELAERCRQVRPNSIIVNCAAVAPGSDEEVTFLIAVNCKGLSSLEMDESRLSRIRQYTGETKVRKVTVPARCMDVILQEHHVSRIDFMTIDVEGQEWEVLCGTDLSRWHPTLLIVERNTLYLSHRLLARLHKNSYQYVFSTGPNDWFLWNSNQETRGLTYWFRLFATQYVRPTLLVAERSVRSCLRRLVHRSG